nr:manganese efflux pump MntP family protein [uncultured Niameybacter sp.]
MSLIEIILIGIGLSMDAVAVSMTNGMVYKGSSKGKTYSMPIFFGVFQGLMPLIGYFAGGLFANVISQYACFLVFAILGFIGGKMIKDGLEHIQEEKEANEQNVEVEEKEEVKTLTYKMLFIQAIATSIDAFAVGIGFSVAQVNILPAVAIIGITTAICSLVAIFIGKKFGDMLGSKSEILGGTILVLIAIKALF